jgi:hypothetical protein
MFPKASRSDRKGCEAVSKVIEGHIREILYNSKAEEVLDQAAKNIIEAGIGCISVDLVQSEQNKFGVEVKIKSEPNFQAVIPDAMSQERDWSDGQHVTRFFYKTKEEFKNEYSDIEIPTSDEFENFRGTELETWYKENTIALAYHYEIITEKENWVKLSDGQEYLKEEGEEVIKEYREAQKKKQGIAEFKQILQSSIPQSPTPGVMPSSPMQNPPASQNGLPGVPSPQNQQGVGTPNGQTPSPMNQVAPNVEPEEEEIELEIVDEREIEIKKVQYYLMTGKEILEGPVEWNSKYLPVVFDVGRVSFVKTERHVEGVANKGKHGQNMVDQHAIELHDALDRSIKAQVYVTPSMLAGLKPQWDKANDGSQIALPVNPDKEGKIQSPVPIQRYIPVTEMQQLGNSMQLIQSSMGMSNIEADNNPNNQSGEAIKKKQSFSSPVVQEFFDMHWKFVQRLGDILVDLITKNYDGERELVTREINLSDKKHAIVNIKAGKALQIVRKDPDLYSALDIADIEKFIAENGKEAIYNSLKDGEYKVIIEPGLPTQTARQEDAVALQGYLSTIGMADDSKLLEKYVFAKKLEGTDELTDIYRLKLIMSGLIEPSDEEEKKKVQEFSQRQKQMMQNNPNFLIQQMKLEEKKLDVQLAQIKMQTEQAKMQGAQAKSVQEGAKANKEIKGTDQDIEAVVMRVLQKLMGQNQQMLQ